MTRFVEALVVTLIIAAASALVSFRSVYEPDLGWHLAQGRENLSGRLVRTLLDADVPPGRHVVTWDGKSDDGRDVSSRVYFYQVVYPDGTRSARRLTIVR